MLLSGPASASEPRGSNNLLTSEGRPVALSPRLMNIRRAFLLRNKSREERVAGVVMGISARWQGRVSCRFALSVETQGPSAWLGMTVLMWCRGLTPVT